jgi:hypothetical protein
MHYVHLAAECLGWFYALKLVGLALRNLDRKYGM